MDGICLTLPVTGNVKNTSSRLRTPVAHLVVFGALLLAALDARADDSGNNESSAARFTGPLVSSSPPLPKGLWNVEPYLIQSTTTGYYDDSRHRRDLPDQDIWRLALPVMYGVTDRLSLGATFNAMHGRDAEGDSGTVIGDTTFSMLYLLADSGGAHTPKLTAAIRQNLDTGRHDRLEQRATSLATGSGARTTTLALYGQAYFVDRNLRGRVNVSGRLPYSGVSIRGASAYGTGAGFVGKADLGSAFEATVGLEYSLGPHWALALDVVYESEQGAAVTGQAIDAAGNVTTVRRKDPSSWRTSVAPAIEYHWNDNVGLIVGAFQSVAGRNAGAVFAPQVAVNVAF